MWIKVTDQGHISLAPPTTQNIIKKIFKDNEGSRLMRSSEQDQSLAPMKEDDKQVCEAGSVWSVVLLLKYRNHYTQ